MKHSQTHLRSSAFFKQSECRDLSPKTGQKTNQSNAG
jgi:hypothetical protein